MFGTRKNCLINGGFTAGAAAESSTAAVPKHSAEHTFIHSGEVAGTKNPTVAAVWHQLLTYRFLDFSRVAVAAFTTQVKHFAWLVLMASYLAASLVDMQAN